MTTTKQEQYKMLDSDFGFHGGDSDSDFGFDAGYSASLSDDEEVVDASFGNGDVNVTAEIDNSSGDDEVLATAEVVMKKQCHCRYMIQEKLMILHQVHCQMNNGESQ